MLCGMSKDALRNIARNFAEYCRRFAEYCKKLGRMVWEATDVLLKRLARDLVRNFM